MRVLKGRVRAFKDRQWEIYKRSTAMAALFSSEWARDYMTAPAPNLFIERVVPLPLTPEMLTALVAVFPVRDSLASILALEPNTTGTLGWIDYGSL